MAIGNRHKKFNEDRSCRSEDMMADRQTHTHHTQTDMSSPYSTLLFEWSNDDAEIQYV